MRHRNIGRQLSRNSSHRKALLQSLTNALLRHEAIKTTLPKAKELRRVAEPLITRAKVDSVHNRRIVFSRLRDEEMTAKLFTEIGPRFQDRPGGYLRIIKCGYRPGDNAPMAYVALVESEEEAQQAAE